MKELYTMEDKIMNAWRCVDDMKLLSESGMGADDLKNALKGLITITDLKFFELWHSYEKVLESNKANREVSAVNNPLSRLTTEQLRDIWDDAVKLFSTGRAISNQTMFEYCLNRIQDAILEQKK